MTGLSLGFGLNRGKGGPFTLVDVSRDLINYTDFRDTSKHTYSSGVKVSDVAVTLGDSDFALLYNFP